MSANEKFWSYSLEEVYKRTKSSSAGLKEAEAESRLEKYGANTLESDKSKSPVSIFMGQFKNPITLILLFATVIAFFVNDVTDAIIILTIIMASSLLSFYQEYNASNAVNELLKIVQIKATVKRDGKYKEIPVEKIVPGDIIHLSTGDVVPADCRIINSNDLSMDESTLTGETFPVEKNSGELLIDTPISKRNNSTWMGTHVVNGEAEAVVVTTGEATEFGSIFRKLDNVSSETDFERGIREFGLLLMRITIILVIGILIINVLLHKPFFNSLLFSLALAVGLTPQLLPAIISINLSYGAREMANDHVIVKKLNAIENFGSMNVLCTDKTGTITQGKVKLEGIYNIYGEKEEELNKIAFINSSLQSGYTNPIDDAICEEFNYDLNLEKIGEIPYSFTTKRLSIGAYDKDYKEGILVSKGALNNILENCKYVLDNGEEKYLEENEEEKIQSLFVKYSQKGLRTLGLAYKKMKSDEMDDEDMIFAGFITLFDPIKEGLKNTIKEINNLGIELKIITGDNQLIAKNIASELDLDPKKSTDRR